MSASKLQPANQSKSGPVSVETAKTNEKEIELIDWMAEVRELLALIISWPVVVLFLVLYLAISKNAARRIAGLFSPFRSVKLFGAEFVLSEEVARNADEAIEVYRKQVRREYDRRIEVFGLRDKLENVVESHVMDVLGGMQNVPNFRCTIHVPDILFAETLYQLLNYYPKGGGRGRTWSFRFGIVGRAWRSGGNDIQGSVPTDAQTLLSAWGMTREEAAAAGQGRKSFACVVLKVEGGTPVGMFYMDSTKEYAFPEPQQQLVEAIHEGCKKSGLTSDLDKLGRELRSRGPVIRLYEQ
jgi:hypothetical protein